MVMKKILFVCLGNICRSPMAEFVMKRLVEEAGRAGEFEIASAATSTEELGNPVYPPARAVLERRGINCEHKRARKITAADYDKFDYIVCMDNSNFRNLNSFFPNDNGQKISKIMSFAGSERDVADPWYTRDFTTTENDIVEGLTGLLKYILSKQ